MTHETDSGEEETLLIAFLLHLGVNPELDTPLPLAIRGTVQSVANRAREAHLELDADLTKFFEYLATKLTESGNESNWGDSLELLPEALSAVHVEDLYLAFLCATEVPTAVDLFERRFRPYIEGICKSYPGHDVFLDDVVQLLRVKLFVSPKGKVPKIASYSGRGSLKSWLQVTVRRVIVDEYRSQKNLVTQLTDKFVAMPDPEVEYLKEKYLKDFRAAFESAVCTLTSYERNFLRLYVLDGITLKRLASHYHVNRSTVVRQMAKVRKKLLASTRREFSAQLGCNPDELSSIMGFIKSRLEVSLERILGTEDGEDGKSAST